MKNIKISYKILIFMGLLTLISGATAAKLLHGIASVNNQSSIIADNWLPALQHSSALNTAFSDFRSQEFKHAGTSDTSAMAAAEKKMSEHYQEAKESMDKYAQLIINPEERLIYEAFQKSYSVYLKIHDDILTYSKNGQKEEANQLLYGDSFKAFAEAGTQIDKMVTLNSNGAAAASSMADQIYDNERILAVVAIALSLLVAIISTVLLSRAVATPISSITGYMDVLSSGDLGKDVPSKERKDEIGSMAQALQIFKDKLLHTRKLESAAEVERKTKEARQERVNAATERFEKSMTSIVKIVASASTELQASANSLASAATQTSMQADSVAAASNESSTNIQTVAASSEQLSASISEISHQVQKSSEVSAEAVAQSQLVSEGIQKLVEAAQRIGAVTNVIREISEQTNLLALNATIEAARAGDAGKGFAVVASEVKNLAASSAKSTEEIEQQIAQIQTSTQEAADAVQKISSTIQMVSEISGAIAAAIEEQSAATLEITRNVSQASSAANEVNSNITSVNEATVSTSASAKELLGAATELGQQAEMLKVEFDSYVTEIRAA